MLISALGGAGGIGKTWLALHWAHRHADRFPDGQLFVDLHGFSPDSPPCTLRLRFAASSTRSASIQAASRSTSTRTALYRSLVTGRRMLIVLDNAATSDQVIPLRSGRPAAR